MRFQWPVPSDEDLKAHIRRYHRATSKVVLERYKFIWREFGPPTSVLLMGGFLSIFTFEEIPLCYIDGYYMACILLAQIFIEDSLGNHYILADEEPVAKNGFNGLINRALQDKLISSRLANQFHNLRSIRNRYVHPRSGDGEGTLIAHFIEKSSQGIGAESDRDLLKDDAENAIRTVIDFLRETAQYDEETQKIIDYLSNDTKDSD